MNNQEEYEIVKRRLRVRSRNKPLLTMLVSSNRIKINMLLARLLDVDPTNGLMFGFNRKNKTAFVQKDNEVDAFILDSELRIRSIELMDFFSETFELFDSDESKFMFTVETKPDKYGRYFTHLVN